MYCIGHTKFCHRVKCVYLHIVHLLCTNWSSRFINEVQKVITLGLGDNLDKKIIKSPIVN